jgi:predicted transcriptional regulator
VTKSDKNTLSGLAVAQSMRRQTVRLIKDRPVAHSINTLIKYKINAVLCSDQAGIPIGVLSKTDIMGAYYAGLPIDSPLEDIMSKSPLFCNPEDSLEKALQLMRSKGVYRLYVTDRDNSQVIGVLAYPDIVGLLYRYCHDCKYSQFRQKDQSTAGSVKRIFVKEIMTKDVQAVFKDDPLLGAVEMLSAYRFGAILVKDREDKPCGVISKTDLILAYKHGVDLEIRAESIMSSPVQSCNENELLEDAIRKMIFSDIHRLFVHRSEPDEIVGVFSLSDAARIRSGSCHACISSRIRLDT